MITAMFLAHLVGDYILQWNKLAAWKAREMKGVISHCLIVLFVTLIFILPFDPSWWPWAVFIGVMHFLIDAVGLLVKLPLAPLGRFVVDQLAHFTVILFALAAGGYLDVSISGLGLIEELQSETMMLYLLGYAFVTMPAWVLVKFSAYGLVKGSAPEFTDSSKYLGILERLLIVTFVVLGQFYMIPLVLLPRLMLELPRVAGDDNTAVYLAELLVSVLLAIMIGLVFYFL